MRRFTTILFVYLILTALGFGLVQSNAQNNPTATATSTVYLTLNPTEIRATMTALPTQYAGLSTSQAQALQALMRLGAVEFNGDGSIHTTISISETWLNSAIQPFLPLTGYTSDELYLDIQPDGLWIRILHNGNATIVHCIGSIQNNNIAVDFDWATRNGTALDLNRLASDEAMLNTLLTVQVNTLLSNRIFSHTLDSLSFSDGYIVFEATLYFR